jgi:hypothetical protein
VSNDNKNRGKGAEKACLLFIGGKTNWSNFLLEKFGNTPIIVSVHTHQHSIPISRNLSCGNTQQEYLYIDA